MQPYVEPDPPTLFETAFLTLLFCLQGIAWGALGVLLGWVWWAPY